MDKYKTFGELDVGDIIYKIHTDFSRDNYGIEKKTISIIQELPYPGSFHKGDLYFEFKSEDNYNKLLDWDSWCELLSEKTNQSYEEIHQLYISSNERPDSEYLYYATSKEEATEILKKAIKVQIGGLLYKKEQIDKDIKKYELCLKNLEN